MFVLIIQELTHNTVPELRSLRHIIKKEHATNHTRFSAYSGPPNEANIAAWEHLLQRKALKIFLCSSMVTLDAALYFNATKEELIAVGVSPESAVKVKDGGYVASLGVYHEMHCLVCRVVDTPSNMLMRTVRTNCDIFFTVNKVQTSPARAWTTGTTILVRIAEAFATIQSSHIRRQITASKSCGFRSCAQRI
jgi:hypothetical protein